MRFLALLNLFLYFMLSLHTSFDGHVQVLCIEKDGQINIETIELSQITHTETGHKSDTHFCCAEKPRHCEGCTDYFIGTGHPDTLALSASSSLDFQALNTLQLRLPATSAPPVTAPPRTAPVGYPPPARPSPTLNHIPSTVLLI